MILMYYPTYDPEAKFNSIGHRQCRGVFHPATYEGGELTPGAECFHEMWKNCKLPLWVLHPGIYTNCGQLTAMHTRLRLPDDTITFPYDNGDNDCNKSNTEAAKLL
ncbi:uncharacterized protein LY79DRAFT_593053 [Colletotrichum navitas]|uniref:Uncharacterized protein n=1 Tax=Colletotrichum navitas TaxID=681940 RepID=A0AAD8PRZ8_9PEZI|nr:uncharacterized protein LY79DRAFT_593053 [Colletotrichum navitas]KAK1579162.1 hypothetical protein LY79DRAFT_593053 [Colletotrichum navitas]